MDILKKLNPKLIECCQKISKELKVNIEIVLSVATPFFEFKYFSGDEKSREYFCFKDLVNLSNKKINRDKKYKEKNYIELSGGFSYIENVDEIYNGYEKFGDMTTDYWIENYTSDGYVKMNKRLRKGEKWRSTDSTGYKIFQNILPVKNSFICFRYADGKYYKGIKPGDVLVEKSYTSTSLNPKFTFNVLENAHRDFGMRIFVNANTKIFPVLYCDEDEIIFSPGLKLLFLCEIKMSNKKYEKGVSNKHILFRDFLVVEN